MTEMDPPARDVVLCPMFGLLTPGMTELPDAFNQNHRMIDPCQNQSTITP